MTVEFLKSKSLQNTVVALLFIVFAFFNCIRAQNSDSASFSDNLSLMSYIDLYYGYDLGNPENHNRPDFLYNYHRHNEVNLNAGIILLNYEEDRVRGNFGLMTGTYANRNLSHEMGLLKNIYQANIGVQLSKNKPLWLTVGVLESHIGFEGVLGAENWTMTRSLLAENSPYYSSGAQLTYTSKNKAWDFSGLLLNGWQQITRVDGNQSIAFGHQIQWRPDEELTLNSSSFLGNVYPDEIGRMRYFHNFYTQFQGNKLGFTLGVDTGFEERINSSDFNHWIGAIILFQYKIHSNWSTGIRGEFFSDRSGVVIAQSNFENLGLSLNLDYKISDKVLARIEGRSFKNQRDYFFFNDEAVDFNYYFGASISLTVSD